MRAAVEEAMLFGFTGTPIENDDHNRPVALGFVKDDGTIERYMGKPYTVTDVAGHSKCTTTGHCKMHHFLAEN